MGTCKFGHAAITVSDIDVSLGFYRDLLGMKVAVDFGVQPAESLTRVPGSTMRILLLSTDDGLQSIEMFQFMDTPQRKPEGGAMHEDFYCSHVAFLVDPIQDYYERLVADGAAIDVPLTEIEGWTYAYLRDPDGFLVELIQG